MKAAKFMLAVLLAAGAVAAYWYFPNPLEQAEQSQAAPPAPAPAGTDAPKPAAPAEAV
jgi:hypothetical protein